MENSTFDKETFMQKWGIVDGEVCILTEEDPDETEETLEAVIYE